MHTLGSCRWTGALALALVLLPSARADLIYLKDGYVIQGKIRRESVVEFDSVSKEMVSIPRGFFMVDDGPRRLYFSPKQVSIVERLAAPTEPGVLAGRSVTLIGSMPDMPVIEEVVETKEWDYKTWQREFFFRAPGNRPRVGLKQMIERITPYHLQMGAITKHRWHSAYLLREFEPDTIYKLLKANKAFAEPATLKPNQIVARRMRLINFLTQAGWFDLAEKELDRLVVDMPEQKSRVLEARAVIDQQRAKDAWEQIKTWYQAGRVEAVGDAIKNFPLRNASDKVLADLREVRTRLSSQADSLKQASAALAEWSKEAKGEEGRELARASGVIAKEVHPANVERLEAFLSQAREAARRKARGAEQALKPEELLSLAVSGFLLGSPSATTKPAVALNLWKTRVFALEYVRETNAAARKKLLETYQKDVTPRVEIDEIAQMIDHLPPVEPAEKIGTEPTEEKCGPRGKTTYDLLLPPEYTHNRQYPVIVALNHVGEKPADMIKRLQKLAADHGYIVAAPEWGRLANGWNYDPDEHDRVLDTIRDLKRRFQVDGDRVFLIGLGEGAKGAFDVGLSHPDLFAGVMTMGAGPLFFPRRYWRNAQFLPIYAVSGTRIPGESAAALREQFTNWVSRGFPAIWVEYKGRGMEWLSGELPLMFDWMRNQKRAFPLHRLGTDGGGGVFGQEFTTLRPDDNRFYWLSTTGISKRCQMPPGKWSNFVTAATMTAAVTQESNLVVVKTLGLSQLSVWIGRDAQGRYLLDLDRPVTIRVGLDYVWNNKKVPASLGVLMEDLYRRGDRKQLYVARVDINIRP